MSKKTIKLKKYLDIVEELSKNDGNDITPGMLLGLESDGRVQPHDDQGGDVLPMFALEDELQGGTINDDYDTEDDPVQVWVPVRGEIVYAVAASGAISAGDFVESNGDGKLRALDEDDYASDDYQAGNRIVGQAVAGKETISGNEDRVQVRII